MFVKNMRQSPIESVYLINHRLLTKHQSGNRGKKRFHRNIAVTDMLLEAMDNKQLSVVLYLGMFQVLDSVHHDLLLQII